MKKNVRKAKYQEFEKSNPERKDEKFGEKGNPRGIRGESWRWNRGEELAKCRVGLKEAASGNKIC